MTKTLRALIAIGLSLAPAALAPAGEAGASATPRWVATEKLYAEMSPSTARLPERLYTEALRQAIREKKVPAIFGVNGRPEDGLEWLKVPEELWREIIVGYAPVTMLSKREQHRSPCPFCGKPYAGCGISGKELLANPHQARTRCCGAIVYEREADMPADYKARPNHTEHIPHLDGTTHPYRFYCPPGTADAPVYVTPAQYHIGPLPANASKRRLWFCSAGEVWRARLFRVFGGGKLFRGLAARVFQQDDAKAARTLAVVLDRLADVYPGLPLHEAVVAQGFPRGRDDRHYLTREEYLSHDPQGSGTPFWYRAHYNLARLNWDIPGWHDGVIGQAGEIVEAFDLIRDHPAVRAYSVEKYRDPGAWERRVRERLVQEVWREARCGRFAIGGNTAAGSIGGGFKLAIVCRDKPLMNMMQRWIEGFYANHILEDGMIAEGSYVYGGMVTSFLGYRSLLAALGLPDMNARYPILKRCHSHPGDLMTLFGTDDTHADEYLFGFRGTYPWALGPPPEGPPDPARHEVSACYPEGGIVCLRGGKPGSRLEAFMDFQNIVGHTQGARLNLQLFYEGMTLMPDMGYANTSVDPTKAPWKDLKYPFELLPIPKDEKGNPLDMWWVWYSYANDTHCHCVGRIDNRFHCGGPCRFHRFVGRHRLGTPGYVAQFADADAVGMFRVKQRRMEPREDVDVFRRQIVALTLPGGRAVLVDIHRLRGGMRHDMQWHVPAGRPKTSLGEPARLPSIVPVYLGEAEKDIYACRKLVSDSVRWPWDGRTWTAEWTIEPAKYAARSEWATTDAGRNVYGMKGQGWYAHWARLYHDVHLRLWSGASGDAARSEVLGEQRPWPTRMKEKVGNAMSEGTIAWKDAMNHLVVSRIGEKPGLATAFVHVLEPRNPDQPNALRNVEVLPGDASSNTFGAGAVLTLEPGAGGGNPAKLWVGTTLDGGRYKTVDLEIDGRLGVACPSEATFSLFDGVRLSAGGWTLRTTGSWKLALAGVIGDLTGQPAESALLVRSKQPLPTDGTLADVTVTVYHQIKGGQTSAYTIEEVTRTAADAYRLDLKNHPRFIRQRTYVTGYNYSKNPKVIHGEYGLRAPGPDNLGRRLCFPGKRLDLELEGGEPQWNSHDYRLAHTPPKDAIKKGDPFFIYTIAPGDTVVIPAHAAIAGRKTGDGLDLDILSLTALELTVPVKDAKMERLAGEQRENLPAVAGAAGTTVRLATGQLPDGRATLRIAGYRAAP
ncbi:MAG: hypothetical protein JXR37_21455 [Kiritimatiellae bacterium]|nr:hypothetical protein [Kiritimatiellia bacterium]